MNTLVYISVEIGDTVHAIAIMVMCNNYAAIYM